LEQNYMVMFWQNAILVQLLLPLSKTVLRLALLHTRP